LENSDKEPTLSSREELLDIGNQANALWTQSFRALLKIVELSGKEKESAIARYSELEAQLQHASALISELEAKNVDLTVQVADLHTAAVFHSLACPCALSTPLRSDARYEEDSSDGDGEAEMQETQHVDKHQQRMLLDPNGRALTTVMRDSRTNGKKTRLQQCLLTAALCLGLFIAFF
jgi:hypothetical protein